MDAPGLLHDVSRDVAQNSRTQKRESYLFPLQNAMHNVGTHCRYGRRLQAWLPDDAASNSIRPTEVRQGAPFDSQKAPRCEPSSNARWHAN
jgi:hypothetical protein